MTSPGMTASFDICDIALCLYIFLSASRLSSNISDIFIPSNIKSTSFLKIIIYYLFYIQIAVFPPFSLPGPSPSLSPYNSSLISVQERPGLPQMFTKHSIAGCSKQKSNSCLSPALVSGIITQHTFFLGGRFMLNE